MNGEDHTGLRETPVASKRIFEGRIVCLRVDDVSLPNGRQTKREVVEHKSAVAIVPLLPGNRVLLVRQWRHAVGEELLEIPAGLLEPDEEPVECARRELVEETGYSAGRIESLASFYTSPGFTDERLHLFLATDLQPAEGTPDEDEAIQAMVVPWDEALAMCWDGRIRDGKTLFGLVAAQHVTGGSSPEVSETDPKP